MNTPTKQQIEELSIEALEQSYGSLKMDPDKVKESLKQGNRLKIKQIWKEQRLSLIHI